MTEYHPELPAGSAPDRGKKRGSRPAALVLLVALSLLAAGWNLLRSVQGILFWSILGEYGARPGAWYIVVTGVLWMVLDLAVAWGLWARKLWAWYAAGMTGVLFSLWYWGDRLYFQETHANGPFSLATTFILLAIILVLLFWPGTRQSFLKGNYERQSKN